MWGPMSLDEQMTTWTWSVLKTSKRIVVKLLPFTVFTATTKELVDRIPSPPVTASLTPRLSTKWISLSPRNTTQTSGEKITFACAYVIFFVCFKTDVCVEPVCRFRECLRVTVHQVTDNFDYHWWWNRGTVQMFLQCLNQLWHLKIPKWDIKINKHSHYPFKC